MKGNNKYCVLRMLNFCFDVTFNWPPVQLQVLAEKDWLCSWRRWSRWVAGSNKHHVGTKRADIGGSGLVEVVTKLSGKAGRGVGWC